MNVIFLLYFAALASVYINVLGRHIGTRHGVKRKKIPRDPTKRYDIPPITDERKGLSNDIARELMFSGHDDNEVVSSMKNKNDNFDSYNTGKSIYNTPKESSENIIKDIQQTPLYNKDTPAYSKSLSFSRKNTHSFTKNARLYNKEVSPYGEDLVHFTKKVSHYNKELPSYHNDVPRIKKIYKAISPYGKNIPPSGRQNNHISNEIRPSKKNQQDTLPYQQNVSPYSRSAPYRSVSPYSRGVSHYSEHFINKMTPSKNYYHQTSPYSKSAAPYRKEASPYTNEVHSYTNQEMSPYSQRMPYYSKHISSYSRDAAASNEVQSSKKHYKKMPFYNQNEAPYRKDLYSYRKYRGRNLQPYRKIGSFNREEMSPFSKQIMRSSEGVSPNRNDMLPYYKKLSSYSKTLTPYNKQASPFGKEMVHYNGMLTPYSRELHSNNNGAPEEISSYNQRFSPYNKAISSYSNMNSPNTKGSTSPFIRGNLPSIRQNSPSVRSPFIRENSPSIRESSQYTRNPTSPYSKDNIMSQTPKQPAVWSIQNAFIASSNDRLQTQSLFPDVGGNFFPSNQPDNNFQAKSIFPENSIVQKQGSEEPLNDENNHAFVHPRVNTYNTPTQDSNDHLVDGSNLTKNRKEQPENKEEQPELAKYNSVNRQNQHSDNVIKNYDQFKPIDQFTSPASHELYKPRNSHYYETSNNEVKGTPYTVSMKSQPESNEPPIERNYGTLLTENQIVYQQPTKPNKEAMELSLVNQLFGKDKGGFQPTDSSHSRNSDKIITAVESSNINPMINPEDDSLTPVSQSDSSPLISDLPSSIDGVSVYHHDHVGLPQEDGKFVNPFLNNQQYNFASPNTNSFPGNEGKSLINIGLVNPVRVPTPMLENSVLPTVKDNVHSAMNEHHLQVKTDKSIKEKPTEKRYIQKDASRINTHEVSQDAASVVIDENVAGNTRYIMEQVNKKRKEQKQADRAFRQEVQSLNNKEQTVAASEALKDDQKNLDVAQEIADDNTSKSASTKGYIPVTENLSYKRHVIGSGPVHNSHHYLVDPEPVHYHHHRYVHVYPTPKVQSSWQPPYFGQMANINPLVKQQHYGHNRGKHVFDQMFPNTDDDDTEVLTEPPEGYKAAAMLDYHSVQKNVPSIKKVRNNYALVQHGGDIKFMHLNGRENMNTDYVDVNKLYNNKPEPVLTLPTNDDATANVVSDLSKGKDLTHVKGEDHVHIKQQEGGHTYDGWVTNPYTYGGRIGNGWSDHPTGQTNNQPIGQAFDSQQFHQQNTHTNDEPIGQAFDSQQQFQQQTAHANDEPIGQAFYRPPIRRPPLTQSNHQRYSSRKTFPIKMAADDEEQDDYGDVQYSSLDMPVHGSVVSEKDAKKIGLYDDSYLKKLGIWEDANTGGIWNGGVPWGMTGIPWGNGGLNQAWMKGLIDNNADLRGLNNTSKKVNGTNGSPCMIPADIAFLFDASKGSSKKKEYFETFVEFAKQVIGYHQPSLEGYHYGAVVYSDSAHVQFDFEKSYEMNGVFTELEELKNISLVEKGSNMEQGLRVSKEDLFDKTAREWVQQVLIILTDTKGEGDVEKWARQLRDSTVNIYLIGLANSDSTADIGQMEKIGTKPLKHHVFQVTADHLLGTTDTVSHPQYLARIIPNQICRLNLIFVIDMNFTSNKTMTNIKNFIKESSLNIGLSQWGSHVALIGYGQDVADKNTENENWDLMSKLDHGSINQAVDNLSQEGQRVTNLGRALELAHKYFKGETKEPVIGSFWRYINVTIVINTQEVIEEYGKQAQNLRDNGVIIHAIGINMTSTLLENDDPLVKIASCSEEFHIHHLNDTTKLKMLAKSMQQYLSQLLYAQESETKNIEGGWKASYGNIMMSNLNVAQQNSTTVQNKSNSTANLNSTIASTLSNATLQEVAVPLTETLSQEPDWSKYLKKPTFEPTVVSITKDDVELQDNADDIQTASNKNASTRQKINRHNKKVT